MQIEVTRTITFNLGRYEPMVVSFTLTGIPDDTPPSAIAEQLDDLLAPHVERARLATVHNPDDNVTSIHTWSDIVGLPPLEER